MPNFIPPAVRLPVLRLPALRLTVAIIAASAATPAVAQTTADSPVVIAMNLRAFSPDGSFERQFDAGFLKEFWRLYPERAIAAGQYEFAARTSIADARSRARELGQINEWLSQLHRFDPAALDDANRSDWWLLKNTFEAQRWKLTEYRAWEWNPAMYDAGRPLLQLLHADYAPTETKLRLFLKRLEEVSVYYTAAKQNLAQPSLEHTHLAIEQNTAGMTALSDELLRQIESSRLRDSEKALFTRRIGAARLAIQDYIGWLQARESQMAQRGARSFRLGRQLYEQKFVFLVQTGGTAEGLHRRALQEKEELHSRMSQWTEMLWPQYFPDNPAPADPLARIGAMVTLLKQRHEGVPRPAMDGALEVFPMLTGEIATPSPVRQFFGSDATLVGWQFYRQRSQLEGGSHSPEQWLLLSLAKLEAVSNALLDYGVHVQNMDEQQALQLLTGEAFMSSQAAQERWRQAQLSSVQLATEFAGYAAIYDLREQLRAELGSRFDLGRFNRHCESYERAPVTVIKDSIRPAVMAQVN